MTYRPITDFSVLRKLPERFMVFTHKALAEGGYPVWLEPGTRIQFSTKIIEASGTVLSIDYGAVYPIWVEWFTADGDKRITSFSPDEFITFTIKEYAMPAHGQKSSVSSRLYDAPTSTWAHPGHRRVHCPAPHYTNPVKLNCTGQHARLNGAVQKINQPEGAKHAQAQS